MNKRMHAIVKYIEPGRGLIDVGTDHGYLGIYLLQQGIAAHVYASDIREQPQSWLPREHNCRGH